MFSCRFLFYIWFIVAFGLGLSRNSLVLISACFLFICSHRFNLTITHIHKSHKVSSLFLSVELSNGEDCMRISSNLEET